MKPDDDAKAKASSISIDSHLKKAFGEFAAEELPPQLTELLDRLRQQDSNDGGSEASN